MLQLILGAQLLAQLARNGMDQRSPHQQRLIFNHFVAGSNPFLALICCCYCFKKKKKPKYLKERSSVGLKPETASDLTYV